MMNNPGDILISVEERHASNMLAGKKSVELRRKPLNISSGTRVWVYSKLPRGQVQALAFVDEVVAGTPEKIWNSHGAQSAITKSEFDAYFADAKTGYAIVFEEVRPLAPILSLSSIREKISHFHPPQFFKRLTCDGPELTFFQTALVTK
ncbi:MAG: transcriptional regulator [Alphaproteobacteria bacterium]